MQQLVSSTRAGRGYLPAAGRLQSSHDAGLVGSLQYCRVELTSDFTFLRNRRVQIFFSEMTFALNKI